MLTADAVRVNQPIEPPLNRASETNRSVKLLLSMPQRLTSAPTTAALIRQLFSKVVVARMMKMSHRPRLLLVMVLRDTISKRSEWMTRRRSSTSCS
jgi:hypothetical protein